MKKKSCLILALILMMIQCVSAFLMVSVTAEEESNTYDIYKMNFASFSPDGIANEPEWAKIPKSSRAVYFSDYNNRLEDEVFQAYFKAAWSPNQDQSKIDVYFLIEVTDNTVYSDLTWEADALGLFLQDKTEASKRWTGFKNLTGGGFSFTDGTNAVWVTVGINDIRAEGNTSTYTVEFKYTFSKNDQIGFDFWIQDNYTGLTEYGRFSRTGSDPNNDSMIATCNIKDETPPLIIETLAGASIRVDTANEDYSGIRFASTVDVAHFEELKNAGATITTGTLIVPTESLNKQNISDDCFTKEKLDAAGFVEGLHYYDIVNTGNQWVKDITGNELVGTWYGTLYDIKDFERQFSGVGYVTVEINGVKTTMYGGYASDNARSISYVAKKAMENETVGEAGNWNIEQEAVLNRYISKNEGASSGTYRIMQYNVLHQDWAGDYFPTLPFEERANNVANAIIERAPDVLLLTERFEEWAGDTTDSVDLLELLGTDYQIVQDKITYEGITVVNRSPIVYNSLKFKCVESGFERLPEAYAFSDSSNHVKKVITWAILEDVSNTALKGTRFAVFATHWDATEANNEWRQKQTEATQKFINSEKFAGLPIVIGGDFNAVYTESFYNDLITNCGLIDSDMATDNKITYDSVDHIAVSGVTVTTYIARAVSNASDHHPIYCDVKIRMPIHLESGEWGRTDNLQDI